MPSSQISCRTNLFTPSRDAPGMTGEQTDALFDALGRNPDVDLPDDPRDFSLVAEFLDRNPGYVDRNPGHDHGARGERLDKREALQGTDQDVYGPDGDAELERLDGLLERHDDLELLAKLLQSDDLGVVLEGLGHGGASTAAAGASTAAPDASAAGEADEDDGGWFSDDDDDDFFDHEDLDQFGERLSYVAGGLVCLVAVVASFFQGITVYKDVDSWILTVEVANGEVVLGVMAVAALVLGVAIGFVYRVAVDDVHDGYRGDLTAATFEVPLVGAILGGLLYLASPVLLNLVNLLLVDAFVYLLGLVIVLAIVGMPLLVALFVALGVVVGIPAYAGIFGGSLFGRLAST